MRGRVLVIIACGAVDSHTGCTNDRSHSEERCGQQVGRAEGGGVVGLVPGHATPGELS